MTDEPLFRKVDCLALRVTDLNRTRSTSTWASATACSGERQPARGFDCPNRRQELVLQTERPGPETDLTVAEVPAAVERFVAAGGRVVVEPFDIAILVGAPVVADPWDNHLVILDNSKGHLVTDEAGK